MQQIIKINEILKSEWAKEKVNELNIRIKEHRKERRYIDIMSRWNKRRIVRKEEEIIQEMKLQNID